MKKFRVQAREQVYYEIEIEAENEAELNDLLNSGDVNWGDAIDGDNFFVEYVEDITNE